VANYEQNGGRNGAMPDESRPSWRPQDQQSSQGFRSRGGEDDRDYRSWRERGNRDDDRPADRPAERDPRRWEGSRGSELGYSYGDDREARGRSTERYGQGQSGYSAGRYGDDRSQQLQLQNRNEMVPPGGGFEDRYHDLGVDDRFTGRGRSGYWQDRGGYEPERYGVSGGHGGGRGYEAERIGARPPVRGTGYDDRMGYQSSSRAGTQTLGYPTGGYGGYGQQTQRLQDEAYRYTGSEPHSHRGTGPHRGKGPVGYQRSDERVREMICESLADDDQLDATHVEVSVKNGEVTLSGSVDDRQAKRDAEDCVCSVAGVRDVQNLLRVKDERKGNPSAQPSVGRTETEAVTPQDKKYRA